MGKRKRGQEDKGPATGTTDARRMILAGLGAVVVLALVVASVSRREAPGSSSASLPAPASGAVQPAPLPVQPQPSLPAAPSGLRVPHFHKTLAEAGPLPRVLDASQFSIPAVARAYRAAARIPKVLAVQPCYCYCDKLGHGSLLDCFATDHGAG